MNVLDILLIAILAGCILNGYFKGFFKELIEMASFVIGLIIFVILYPFIENLLTKSDLYIKIQNSVVSDLNLMQMQTGSTEQIASSINLLNIPEIFKTFLIQNNTESSYQFFNATNPVEYISNFMSTIIVALVTAFTVILITSIIVSILTRITKFIKFLPLASTFDKIAGIAFGFFNGIFTILLIGIVILVLSIFPRFSFLSEQINGVLAQPLIANNPLFEFLIELILKILE